MNNNKNIIDEFGRRLFKSQAIYFVAFLIAYTLFHAPIELFITKTFVELFFKGVATTILNDIICFILLLSFTLFYYLRRRKYIVSNKITWIIIVATILYLYYRFISNVWTFTPFDIWTKIKYADLIFIPFCGNICLLIKNKKVNSLPLNDGEAFFDDESLGEEKIDELGYSGYAKMLRDKIIHSNFKKAFAIGINGKWGLGKTSFIDLIKRGLNHEQIIIIDFNPWNSNTPQAIINDFFDTIQEAIKPFHSSLSRLLVLYADKLVSINDSNVTKSIHAAVTAIAGHESINTLFLEINNSLQRIQKKIIIVIDDLDRLDKEEIIEVIRLIRNTANFHNTFFIVAYDRNYIVKALQQHNPYNHEQFLEKIFQIEVTLPYFKKDIFRFKLLEKLKRCLPQSIHKQLENEILGDAIMKPEYLNDWILSMRDVTRLANSISLNLTKLIGEVDVSDFLKLEILRFKYHSVYELLFNRTSQFFDNFSRSNDTFTYQLKGIKNAEQEIKNHELRFVTTELQLYLYENFQNLSIPKSEIDNIVHFVAGIFDGPLSYRYHTRSNLSVIHPSKFNRYFAYYLLEGNLSEIEFSSARSLHLRDFNSKISEWVDKGLESELHRKILEIKGFDNKDDFEKVIRAIFHFANLKSKSVNESNRIIGYDVENLYSKLYDYDERISSSYYKDNDGKEGLRKFIKELFDNAVSPFIFEADFIRHLNGQFLDIFSLTKEELNKFVFNYFKNYCDHVGQLNDNVWSLYHSCTQTEWIPAGPSSHTRRNYHPDEANSILKDLIGKDLDNFLLLWIDIEPFKQNMFAIGNFPVSIYGDWKKFKEYLDNQDEQKWKYLKEFKKLYDAYEATNFSSMVPFEFKDIPIERKFRRN